MHLHWIFPVILIFLSCYDHFVKMATAGDMVAEVPFLCQGNASSRSISAVSESKNLVASFHLHGNAFNDADRLGGIDEIEKIKQIEVFLGDVSHIHHPIVTQIKTTYLLKNGQVEAVTNGQGGVLAGTVNFDDGQYLLSIQLSVDDVFIHHIRFCRSGDEEQCFGPFGGDVDSPSNYLLFKERSVIVSLLGHAKAVVNRIHVVFETDKVHRISIDVPSTSFQEIITPMIASDLAFDSTDSKVMFDNLGQPYSKSTHVTFQETVMTYESSEVFNHLLYVNVSIPPMVNKIPLFYQSESSPEGLANNFSIGMTFTKLLSSLKNSTFFAQELQQTIESHYIVTVLPNSVVTAQVFWRKIMYSYYWKIPILCFYASNPNFAIVDSESKWMEGTIFGSQAFPESFLSLTTTTHEDGTGGKIPSSSPTTIAYASSSPFLRGEKQGHFANLSLESPSHFVSTWPSNLPSLLPTEGSPSDTPSDSPSDIPSIFSTEEDDDSTDDYVDCEPSFVLSSLPSEVSSYSPSDSPSDIPSFLPAVEDDDLTDDFVDCGSSPSYMPSLLFSDVLSYSTSGAPSDSPSDIPSSLPTVEDDDLTDDYVDCVSFPSYVPSLLPSEVPSFSPSDTPSDSPSGIPSSLPSFEDDDSTDDYVDCDSSTPTESPSVEDDDYFDCESSTPSESPSDTPSFLPSELPSDLPTAGTSGYPSFLPSEVPADLISSVPSDLPSVGDDFIDCESGTPTGVPSDIPSDSIPIAVPTAISQPVLHPGVMSPMVFSSSFDRLPSSVVTGSDSEESYGLTSGCESFAMSIVNRLIHGCFLGILFVVFP